MNYYIGHTLILVGLTITSFGIINMFINNNFVLKIEIRKKFLLTFIPPLISIVLWKNYLSNI